MLNINISSFVGQTKLYVMKKDRSNCPLTSVLDIIGDKWSLIIIRDIFLGKKRFTEFIKSSEKIATNILANRLELLLSLIHI